MYWSTWFQTTGLRIFSLKRSITVGDIRRLSLTERHWNWNLPDPWAEMLARLAEDYREEMLQRDMDEDSEVRLTALDCERCRSPVDHVLTMSAGEAVCDGCIDAELSE